MAVQVVEASVLAFASTFLGVVVYFIKVAKNQTPVVPVGLLVSLVLGIGLGGYAILQSFAGGPGDWLIAGFLGGIPVLTGVSLFWILSQRKTPVGNLKVRLGDSMPAFEVLDSEGQSFTAEDLKGQRTLFKFYRGSWCPYCCAELNMFETLGSELGVKVVALSGDTVADAANHKIRDGLSHRLLSDPHLDVVKQFGVEHHKALGGDSKETRTLFGIPFPARLKYKSMAIPTTLLVDEFGKIRWIDQSDDYRIRASRERVSAAIAGAFDQH